jgi:hypothetical protein
MNKPENSYANDVEGSDERKKKNRGKKKEKKRKEKMPLGRQINDDYNYKRRNGNVWT